MKLSELMANYEPEPDFTGYATNDDFVLAIDISGTDSTPESDFEVVEMGVAGLDAQLNPSPRIRPISGRDSPPRKPEPREPLRLPGTGTWVTPPRTLCCPTL